MSATQPAAAPAGRSDQGSAKRSQADRRSASRAALLESAARGLSRYGYSNLVLEQVAGDAGYTRGALYHQFKDKQELTLAAFEWVLQTWTVEVGQFVERAPDPLTALLTLAGRHAVLCRRDVARVALALRVEFAGQDHPVGRAVEQAYAQLTDICAGLIDAARATGVIAPASESRVLALAFIGAIEGTVIALAGEPPHDEHFAVLAAAGVLGVQQPFGGQNSESATLPR